MAEATEAEIDLMDQLTRLEGKFDAAVTKFQETRPAEPEVAQSRSSGNETHVHVTASGTTTIVAIVVALVTSILYLQQTTQIAVLQRKVDRMEDYQLTSYMLLPELRKKIEENLSKRKPEK